MKVKVLFIPFKQNLITNINITSIKKINKNEKEIS